MTHQHTYDAQGKQLCCTKMQKINNNAQNAMQQHNDNDEHNHNEHSATKTIY